MEQEIRLHQFGVLEKPVLLLCVCQCVRGKKVIVIHLSLMDSNRFPNRASVKSLVLFVGQWVTVFATRLQALFDSSHNYPSAPPPPCRATWCGSWTAMCWSAWRTRTVTTWCRSVSNASSLTHCTSSSKPLRDRWVVSALTRFIQSHTHTHTIACRQPAYCQSTQTQSLAGMGCVALATGASAHLLP